MEKYDYRSNMEQDIQQWIEDTKESVKIAFDRFDNDKDAIAEWMNEELREDDAVTGNGSGSYTFNTWKAEENLCHNMDLLSEACSQFGGDMATWIEKGAAYCDVSIRCYLLGETIPQVLDDIWDDFVCEDEEEEEDEE